MRRGHTHNLAIESLEIRIVPTVTIQAGVDLDADGNADDVRIIGGSEHTGVVITDEGVGTGTLKLSVDKNGDGDFTDAGELQNFVIAVADDGAIIDLQLGSGNDKVTYSLDDNLQASRRRLSIDLGSGNDQFIFNSGERAINQGAVMVVDLLMGSGNDQIGVYIDDLIDSEFIFDANTGTGNDYVVLDTIGNGFTLFDDDARLDFTLDLGTGSNTFENKLSANIGASDRATVDLDLIGGSGVDKVAGVWALILGDGSSVSQVALTADLGAGNDEFSLENYYLDVAVHSLIDTRISGGLGNDKFSMSTKGNEASEIRGVAEYDFLGGAGLDTILIEWNTAPIQVLGQIRFNLYGQEGADSITVFFAVAAGSNGNYSLVAMGGSGNDSTLLSLPTPARLSLTAVPGN